MSISHSLKSFKLLRSCYASFTTTSAISASASRRLGDKRKKIKAAIPSLQNLGNTSDKLKNTNQEAENSTFVVRKKGSEIGDLEKSLKLGKALESLFIFNDLATSDHQRGQITYGHCLELIKALAKRKISKKRDFSDVIAIMRQLNLPVDTAIFNAVIEAYLNQSDIPAARMVLQKMTEEGMEKDSETYAAFLKAYCNKERQDFKGAQRFLEYMKKENITISPAIYRPVLKCALQFSNFAEFDRWVADMESQNLELDPKTLTILMKRYIKSNQLEKAEKLFGRLASDFHIEPDLQLYTTMMDAYSKGNNQAKLLQIYNEINSKGFELDSYVYGILIHGHVRNGEIDQALKVYNEMLQKSKVVPDQDLIHPLLEALCKGDDIVKAITFFEDFLDKGYPIRLKSFTSMLQALERYNLLEKAQEIFRIMEKIEIVPNTICYNVMLRLASSRLDDDLVRYHWEHMLAQKENTRHPKGDKNRILNQESYNIYLSHLVVTHKTQDAFSLCSDMIQAGYQPRAKELLNLLEASVLEGKIYISAQVIVWIRSFLAGSFELD